MGAADSVAYCQQVVEEIFGDLINQGVLALLNDLLGYARTEDELCNLFNRVLERCARFGLKLHPILHAKHQVVRTNHFSGWSNTLPRTQSRLVDLAPLVTAADIQQLLSAANRMRDSIPAFARVTALLYATLKVVMREVDSRKKNKL